MNTDLTPSTKSLTDKRLREYTNEDIWDLLAAKSPKIIGAPELPGAVASPEYWVYSITNGTLMIDLLGGDTYSVPSTLGLDPQEYDGLTIKLWDYREPTEEQIALTKDDTSLHLNFPELGGEFFI